MKVICIEKLKTQRVIFNTGDIFEIFPVRNIKPFEGIQICIKTDIGGYWVNKKFFLPLEEYRNKQLEKLLK